MLTLKILNKFTLSKSAKKEPILEFTIFFGPVLIISLQIYIFLKFLNNIKMNTATEAFSKYVDNNQLRQHIFQWLSFARAIVSLGSIHSREFVVISVIGEDTAWSLVINLWSYHL
jgi:hypothetical protein